MISIWNIHILLFEGYMICLQIYSSIISLAAIYIYSECVDLLKVHDIDMTGVSCHVQFLGG